MKIGDWAHGIHKAVQTTEDMVMHNIRQDLEKRYKSEGINGTKPRRISFYKP
ncbi:hypothetical protein BKA56DRAFT_590297 [Ilyonectria sp. MPI-CAGE-AT-0026]|nr:hypothetical protein BKA56DRAFT_590297 [Ilyonectria sp. MPI-CAGE-AT-0026]